ncbi:MAG: hypothetical protein ABI779_05270 [Acidobacteriota bacterium]
MRCRQHMSVKRHPYALLYHLAGHAVVMEHFDIPLISMRVHPRRRVGAVHGLGQRRDPAGSRLLVERDAICAYAGGAAEDYGCGGSSWFSTLEDSSSAAKRLLRFTHDPAESSAWGSYLRERACVMVREYWHEITVIAAVLQRERAMDRASLGATLQAFRANPFRAGLRPLRPVPWRRPHRSAGKDEVELVWSRPTLSELVARMQR